MIFIKLLMFVLPGICCRLRCASASENLVENESFEVKETGPSRSWKTTDRVSTWSIRVNAQTYQNCLVRRSGRCSTNFAGPVFRHIEAAFISQYIDVVGRLGEPTSGAVRLEFWTSGRQSSQLRARLDVAYVDDYRRMSAVLSPAKREDRTPVRVTEDLLLDEQFVKSCVIVPNYGRVRSMMLHFIVDHKLNEDDEIYLDDVDLQFVSPDDAALETCPLYLDTFPVSRQVLNDFLRPAKPLYCNLEDADVAETVSGITLATQLTLDRLAMLRRAVTDWNGPVSAAVLIFFDPARGDLHSQLQQITTAYYSSSQLRSCTTIHVVVEDLANRGARPDSAQYPANFLRNVAITHARTSHVFYIDVDMFPAFDERQARRWLRDVGETDPPRAYVVPLFHSKLHRKHPDEFPRTKPELLAAVRDPESGLEPYLMISHAPVQFDRWMKTDQPYEIDYVENMEPYFIVRSSAPVMSDLYVGYGRDKCAYSRDIARAGYRFLVLPQAFLINVVDAPGVPTILGRSRGIRLDIFLNAAFHVADMEAGFWHLPSVYRRRSWPTFEKSQASHRVARSVQSEERSREGVPELLDDDDYDDDDDDDDDDDKLYDDDMPIVDQAGSELVDEGSDAKVLVSERLSEEEIELELTGLAHERRHVEARSTRYRGGDDEAGSNFVGKALVSFDQLPTMPEAEATPKIVTGRLDMVVEGLLMSLGVTTYVEVAAEEIQRSVVFFLRLMQPDAGIIVTPYSEENSRVDVDGLLRKYRSRGNLYSVLPRVVADYPRPKIFVFVFDGASTRPETALEHIRATVSHATDADVVLLSDRTGFSSHGHVTVGFQSVDFLSEIESVVSKLKPGWRLYRCAERLVLKSQDLRAPPPPRVPPLPLCRQPEVDYPPVVVDVVLVTRNRPMQTLAFLESLSKYVDGVRTVWVIWRSDDELFRRAYDEVAGCVAAYRHQFNVEWVEEQPGRQVLGDVYLDVVERRSNATHLALCVDELVWLSRIDLVTAIRRAQLDCSGQQQLRLGHNVAIYRQLKDKELRFRPMPVLHHHGEVDGGGGTETADLWAYYPRQLPYDFGWVLHIDGLVVRRSDVVHDFSRFASRCNSPGCLEMSWITQALHVHSRQWQAMYTTSKLVNNALPEDDRVAMRSRPHDGSFALAAKFSRDRLRIDVEAFAAGNPRPEHLHLRLPVKLIDRGDC